MKRLLVALGCATLVLAGAEFVSAQPDVRQMSGIPLPVTDMPAGAVTVRVVREAISNPLSGLQVELQGSGAPLTATTNDVGRAEFKGVPVGARMKAIATVAGERLESQEFTLPPNAGIRLLLVATGPGTETRAAPEAGQRRTLAESPAQPGTVVLGSESRFVIEMGDDGLSVFNIFQVLNTAAVPVLTPQPLVFELPDDAKGATILDGSSPQASAAGRRVTLTGPFAPGVTPVQFVYTLPYSGSDVTLQQKLPAALSQLSVAAQKIGRMHLTSPQLAQQRDATSQGTTYIVAQGPALNAGDVVTFNFTGLPAVPVWPRNLALALAVIILAGGAWASVRGASPVNITRRRSLEARRDRLFGELTAIEQQHGEAAIDPQRYTTRRRELVSALERVYAELDEEGVAVGRAS